MKLDVFLFDNYLNLPREDAYNLYLDERNLRVFKTILWIVIFIFGAVFIITLAEAEKINIATAIALINLIVLITARVNYKRFFNSYNIRKYIFIFLILELLMSMSISFFSDNNENADNKKQKTEVTKKDTLTTKKDTLKKGDITISFEGNNGEDEGGFTALIVFFGIIVLTLRFSKTEIIQLFSIGFLGPIIVALLINIKLNPGSAIPNLIISVLFFVIAFTMERKRRKKFIDQYDFYYRKNYENLRMKKELNYAREIQLSMLPKNEATIGDLRISGISIPASEVGGDYFDYFKISENEVGIFICDVSGHGVASGLLLSGLRSCMHLIIEDHSNPREVIEKLNRMIRKTQNRKMFVTAIFAIIDLEKNKCILYNAGHLPPYKISGETKEIFKIKKHGIALGAMNKVETQGSNNEVILEFNKNDKIVFYTDGVNEAMNNNKVEYGLDNLEGYLNNNADKKTNELLKGLIDDVKKFTHGSVQRDDITLLIVQRNSNE